MRSRFRGKARADRPQIRLEPRGKVDFRQEIRLGRLPQRQDAGFAGSAGKGAVDADGADPEQLVARPQQGQPRPFPRGQRRFLKEIAQAAPRPLGVGPQAFAAGRWPRSARLTAPAPADVSLLGRVIQEFFVSQYEQQLIQRSAIRSRAARASSTVQPHRGPRSIAPQQ